MKKGNTNKSFKKFTSVNTHKRRDKEKRRAELLRALESINVRHDGMSFKDKTDNGRGSRAFTKRTEGLKRVFGTFSGTRSGFGFVTPDGGLVGRDIFIPSEKCGGALDGDYVECTYRVYKNHLGESKTEGRVEKILTFGRDTLIGTLASDVSGFGKKRRVKYYLVPDDSHVTFYPVIDDLGGASVGDKLSVKIKRGVDLSRDVHAEVLSVFGPSYSASANYEAILSEYGIDTEFSEEELELASRLSSEPVSDHGRVRYNNRIIFTIDGEGAKDLDDAVSLIKIKGGWQLGVHIADVSHYVPMKSSLDRAAMKRGTSVYFTDKVVPMLPESLSNGACSLNAGEDKYVLSAIINLDSNAEITRVVIEEGVIRSRVRGVYSEVNRILSGNPTKEDKAKYKEVKEVLFRMEELYRVLLEKRRKCGMIELEEAESVITLSESGDPLRIEKRERGVSERIIEQFMLTANEAVATYLTERSVPVVYRVHEPPPEDKLDALVSYLHNLGFDTSYISREGVTGRDISRVLERASELGISAPVSHFVLRSMSRAYYSEKSGGHFGLAIPLYCHFTSPIRRLSDLATHRIIKDVLISGHSKEPYIKYARRAAASATDREISAVGAERKIENLYKTVYMSGHIGEIFDAYVSSVGQFGVFVMADNTCEGLIPMSELPFGAVFDEKNMCVRYRTLSYRPGDRIRVRLEEADVSRGKIRFSEQPS